MVPFCSAGTVLRGREKELREKKLRDITGIDAVVTKLDQKFVTYYLEKRARLGIECIDVVPATELAKKGSAADA